MQNSEIAAALNEVADLLEISGENVFRIRAYRRAAETVEGFGEPVGVALEHDPQAVPGVGSNIAEHIHELLSTGSIALQQELYTRFPPGVVALLKVQGVGPKLAARVYQELQVSNLDELEVVARDGRLASLTRVGAKTAGSILRNIDALRQSTGRTPLGVARPLALSIAAALQESGTVQQLTVAGSARRFQETVGDLDLVGVSATPDAAMAALVQLPQVTRVLGQGSTKTSVILSGGIQLDLRLVEARDFGSLLQHFTGGKQHNIQIREYAVARGLKISEYGVETVATGEIAHFTDEESLYAYLKLQYIPPELRQGVDEIKLAARFALPRLIEIGDIRGDLHTHTNWSDGSASIEEMVQAATRKGYSYVAISDHSAGLGVANGLTIERLRRHNAEVRAVASRYPQIHVFTASEVDIRADGSMDYPDEVLGELDLVVGSIHSAMGQSSEVTTARLLRAIENPHVDIIGHLTTRLVGKRSGVEFERNTVFAAAARTATALEINAHPSRLDLCDVDVRMALAAGAKLVINTDAHGLDDFDLMEYGVGTARRGGTCAAQVWNAADLQDLQTWLSRNR